MDIVDFVKYPFLLEASRYVKEKGYSIDDIVTKPIYERSRTKGKIRVLDAILGTPHKTEGAMDLDLELLSYPVARMLTTLAEDPYLVKRFALYEAKAAFEYMEADPADTLIAIGRDFGMATRISGKEFVLHFTDYLKHAATIRNAEWKLINRKMIDGMVYVDKHTYARLLEEAVRDRIQSSFTSKVPESLAASLEPYMPDIRMAQEKYKADRNLVTSGEVSQDAFPPCMRYLLSELQKGNNLPHTARFALTSFLANIGLDKDRIMELYRMAPDFREDLTKYQVEHITGGSGTEYTAPSCKTMMTYGNCYGRNKMCEFVTHPLVYYRKALARQPTLTIKAEQAEK